MKNICLRCQKHKDIALFKGEYLCCDCLAEIAIDNDIDSRKQTKDEMIEGLEKEAIKILGYYGDQQQISKTIEELSELQIELCKFNMSGKIPENLPSEIADCHNMLLQVQFMAGIRDSDIIEIRKAKNKIVLNKISGG